MSNYIRVCPACKSERPLTEDICANEAVPNPPCGFVLLDVISTVAGAASPATAVVEPDAVSTLNEAPGPAAQVNATATAGGGCPSCHHPVGEGDALCLACGTVLGGETPTSLPGQRLDDWVLVAQLPGLTGESDLYLGRRDGSDTLALVRHLQLGLEPEPRTYEILEALAHPSVPRLLAHGRVDGRAYEVWEQVDGPTLAEIGPTLRDEDLEVVAGTLIGALTLFERRGLRHGSLQPQVIRQRGGDPRVLAITDFATARAAEFDVEASRLRQPSRYMAPEAVADASTAASDWWSLGMILLELLTKGGCFAGVNDKAYVLHLVARGVELPEDLSPRWRNLLEGLLTRDHEKRWKADQALKWVAGEKEQTFYEGIGSRGPVGEDFDFAGQRFRSPAAFAFTAADEAHWDEAFSALEQGRLATWLGTFDRNVRKGSYDLVSRIGSDERIPKDIRLALALAAINPDIPLCLRGVILNSAELLRDPVKGGQWLAAPVLAILRRLKRSKDHWLTQVAERADRLRARAKDANLDLNTDEFNVLRLVMSTAALDAQWAKQRLIFPDSPHPVLASLIERRHPSDEDLILLLSAKRDDFKPLEQVLRDAETLARDAGVPEFDRRAATHLLAEPRRNLVDLLNERVPGFERSGREKVDAWVDSFRTANRRMPLARLLVVLAVPGEEWKPPPDQDYVESVLGHMHRRVLAGIQRGALLQMRQTASVIDLFAIEPETLLVQLLDAIVARSDSDTRLGTRSSVAPAFFEKVRGLDSKARQYQRDTGLEALFVGFPVLTLLDRSADGEKTRVAPLLLWPVKLNVGSGATSAISLASDLGREVEINPALETILGPDASDAWSTTIRTVLSDGADSYKTLLSALSDLVEGDINETLGALPKAGSIRKANKPSLKAAAALFVAEFPSQAIANDLKLMPQHPLDNTALACLLRLKDVAPPSGSIRVPQLERFNTLESDPSQEEAVARARYEPGLVVQGPPGTGKSQTIVNIITDCLGRGETVLVVCEKKAALDVVEKRLVAEKLGERVVRVENTTTDRSTLLKALQAQLPAVMNDAINHAAEARRTRGPIASQIDVLEAMLDAHHEAVHAPDPRLDLSHRHVLAIIAAQDARARGLSAPALRSLLGALSAAELETIIVACRGLVDIWLTGGLPGSVLWILKPAATDQAQADGVADTIRALFSADAERQAALAARRALPEPYRMLATDDPDALQAWLANHAEDLQELTRDALSRCSVWRPYFSAFGALRREAEPAKSALTALIRTLDRLAIRGEVRLAHDAVSRWPELDIAALAAALPTLAAPPSLFGVFNLPAALKWRTARRLLAQHGVDGARGTVIAHAEAARYETTVRGLANDLGNISEQLAERWVPVELVQKEILAAAHAFKVEIAAFERLASIIDACPIADVWMHVIRAAGHGAADTPLVDLVNAAAVALQLSRAEVRCSDLLDRLKPLLEETIAASLSSSLKRQTALGLEKEAILAALPALNAFQTFRIRERDLTPVARRALEVLAPLAAELSTLDGIAPRDRLEAVMRREAAIAWKEAIETRQPALSRLQSELDTTTAELDKLEAEIRKANQRLLAAIDKTAIRVPAEWGSVLALTGGASRRLRQVFAEGRRLGLLNLRPIWLVNPDVASRMLPLEAGLFDIAIFDEASQMRVADAIPALFRAKRCVISGDEKQLPPTNFFGARGDSTTDDYAGADDAFSSDDDMTIEEDAEAGARRDSEALRIAERHIKDCEDLLALARGFLPETSLDIHYRSAYRELIAFSNAAYYGGRLNVPVHRSPQEIATAKPIEIRRVDGVYRNQTNPDEAMAVVEMLADLWNSGAEPPTVGIVTFNMKQAELIDRALTTRADLDTKFSRALIRERTRKAGGEDVGLFVKNLENVQGDERDWIIFSTTFGRDEDGVFKRFFGALNQQGGERRLNVAVTRAKRKVVMVTSMPTSEISTMLSHRREPTMARDYLQLYVQYAELLNQGEHGEAAKLLDLFGAAGRATVGVPPEPDELVAQALAVLKTAGFAAHLMPREDAFSLDIAVSEPASARYIMGVEIDSPRHALLRHARAREIWRPKLIARSGLKLHRISSAAWVRNPDGERARLIAAARSTLEGARS